MPFIAERTQIKLKFKKPMKMKYIIIKASDSDQLTKEVQSRIDEGWKPQGGVCIDYASNYVFAQAMILKAE